MTFCLSSLSSEVARIFVAPPSAPKPPPGLLLCALLNLCFRTPFVSPIGSASANNAWGKAISRDNVGLPANQQSATYSWLSQERPGG